jgi:hypothetical protein
MKATSYLIKNTPSTTVADPVNQRVEKKVNFPTPSEFPLAISFLLPAELPFRQSKILTYRDKMELKWLLLRL